MIICVDKVSSESVNLLKEWSRAQGVIFQELEQCTFILISYFHAYLNTYSVEAYGEANLVDPIPAYPDLVVSICYTSVCTPRSFKDNTLKVSQGTTNDPKGVILKHKNLALATYSQLHGFRLSDTACLLSYLPLAHIYGVCINILLTDYF